MFYFSIVYLTIMFPVFVLLVLKIIMLVFFIFNESLFACQP